MSIRTEIRPIAPTDTLSLRHTVLRPERPLAESVYDNDAHPQAQHWGAFVEDKLIAIASIYQEPLPESVASLVPHSDSFSNSQSWRLRGMTVPVVSGARLWWPAIEQVFAIGSRERWQPLMVQGP